MTASHRFNPTIMREYDVRGIVGDTLSEADASALGSAFGTRVIAAGGKSIALCRDGRLTSPPLETAMAQSLRATGLRVVRIGVGPTPMVSYAAKALPTDAALMVTGSHNPPDYNGFKMTLLGQPFFGQDIQDLARIAGDGAYAVGAGVIEQRDIRADYVQRLAQEYPSDTALTIGWDPANGAACDVLNDLCTRLPGHHHVINGVIDGTFPNHHPDPSELKNLAQLQSLVSDKRCDLGIAFDGDGDRIGVIDCKGRVLFADQLMVIYARDVLAIHPGAPIIADVKSSQVLFDEVTRMGGQAVMWNTGHSLIKAKLAELSAPLAGEMSGHIFFADRYYGFDDAIYAAVRLLRIIAESGTDLAMMLDAIPAVLNTPELRFPCEESRKFEVIEEVRARLAQAQADVCAIDGVRVNSGGGWWLLRASNTQDVLVARCEARGDDELSALKAELISQLRASGVEPPHGL